MGIETGKKKPLDSQLENAKQCCQERGIKLENAK